MRVHDAVVTALTPISKSVGRKGQLRCNYKLRSQRSAVDLYAKV